MADAPGTPGSDLLPSASTGIPSAARERAVEALTRAFAEDALSERELETALDRVYGARTPAELQAATASLPPVPASEAEPAGLETPGRGETLPSPAPARIRAFLSGHEGKLGGVVPRRMRLHARLGHIELDLRDATFESGITEIEVRSMMGYVQLLLPGDVRIESDGHALFGYFAVSGAASPDADRVVRITGRALFGYAECHAVSRQLDKPRS